MLCKPTAPACEAVAGATPSGWWKRSLDPARPSGATECTSGALWGHGTHQWGLLWPSGALSGHGTHQWGLLWPVGALWGHGTHQWGLLWPSDALWGHGTHQSGLCGGGEGGGGGDLHIQAGVWCVRGLTRRPLATLVLLCAGGLTT
eukprot:354707-Chlamydomonas_euryale.AAC.1